MAATTLIFSGDRSLRNRCAVFLVAILLPLTFVLTSKAVITSPPGPYEYVVATIGAPQSVDPAFAYDTASGELIFNVYETLITFNKESTADFLPMLADSWTISPDGQTYSFHIGGGVHFSDGSTLLPSDVEYSLERVLVRDYTGGPGWMLWEPIFGNFSADMDNPVACGKAIDAAIQSDDGAGTVTIQFATGKPYPPFQAILSQSWGSIMSKSWAIFMSDWPGIGLQDGSWVAYHDPAMSPLDGPPSKMMGTGPYKLDYLISTGWSVIKFDGYWGGWGNPRRGYAARGYVTRFTELFITDWHKRHDDFSGSTPIYDSIYIPRAYIAQMWQQPGIRCIYPFSAISVDAMFFNYDTGPNSPYIGDGQWGEGGIIPTFFSDVHARKAVAYSFNWTKYILDAYFGEAKQNSIPAPDCFKLFAPFPPVYGINLTAAAGEWAQAWGGLVLANGFRFTLTYNTGSVPRQTSAQIIKTNLEATNPKFHVDVVEVPWPTYLGDMHSPLHDGRATMVMFQIGWLADFPDVDNFVGPFIASWGGGYAQSIYLDPYSHLMDDYIRWGFGNTTDEGRAYNYNQLYQLYHERAPSLPMVQGIGRYWARDWVQGWYYNSIYPGTYAYSIWKEEQPWEDINSDGKVDIKDLAAGAKAYGAYYVQPILPPYPSGPPGYHTPNWNSRYDVNIINPANGARADMKVDIKDLAAIASLYGYEAPQWTPP